MVVDKFFCFRLESTAKFFGWLGGVFSVILMLSFAIILGNLHELVEYYKSYGYSIEDQALFEDTWKVIAIVVIIATCINLVANICLVVGTDKRRHKLLLPTLSLGTFANVHSAWSLLSPPSVSVFFIVLSILAFNVYVWIAIYSLYKIIKSENDKGRSILSQMNDF